jgi:hypothetical protein
MSEEVKPFRVEVPEHELDDLRDRRAYDRYGAQGGDEMLDDITPQWRSGTAASSARLYWERFQQVAERFTSSTIDTVTVPRLRATELFIAEVRSFFRLVR